jgi:fructose-1,6-bisphosphatase/inositol monophosphatase family enzyme
VRPTRVLAEATLFTTTPALFPGTKRAAYDRVEREVRLARYGADCYAYAMLASGTVDLVVEAGLQPYDIVALVPIIEQAGGVITRWDGGPAEQAGDIVAAATPELHRAALDLLNG